MAKLVFLGSPEPAAVCLTALAGAGHEVVLVVSAADKRRGRGSDMSATPAKRAALALGLPVTDKVGEVSDAGADLGVVVAYGRLIRPAVLERLPMINVHFSLLPRWRGAAPVERAILAGDSETGVALMKLDEGLDTGPVYTSESTPIFPDDTLQSLSDRLAALGAAMLVRNLAGGVDALGSPTPQVGQATYAAKLSPEELRIDWSMPADVIGRYLRIGRAWTTFRGSRLGIWEAVERPSDVPGAVSGQLVASAGGSARRPLVATGSGLLELATVQPEGRRRLDAAEWLRGARPGPGESFA